MIKTQIHIPDDLDRRVKRLAESQEWSWAETLRRAAEPLLAVRPAVAAGGPKTWRLVPAGSLAEVTRRHARLRHEHSFSGS